MYTDTHKGLHVNLLLLSDFSQTSNISTSFGKTYCYQIPQKLIQWFFSCSMCTQTNMAKLTNKFLQLHY